LRRPRNICRLQVNSILKHKSISKRWAQNPTPQKPKGGALGSTTEAERAHPYSLGIDSTVPSGDEGVCFAGPESRERCGSRYSNALLVGRVRIFCSEFVTAVCNCPYPGRSVLRDAPRAAKCTGPSLSLRMTFFCNNAARRLTPAPTTFLLLWLSPAAWRRRRSTSAIIGYRWRGSR